MIIPNNEQTGYNGYVINDYTNIDEDLWDDKTAYQEADRISNTRSDLLGDEQGLRWRFDWMTWIGDKVGVSVLETLLDKFFGDEYEVREYKKSTYRGAKEYTQEFKSANGAVMYVRESQEEVAYDDIDIVLEEAKYDLILSLSGRPLAIFYQDNDLETPVKDFIVLTDLGLHPSRLDLKFIDFDKVLDFKELEKHGKLGNYRGVKRHKSDIPIQLSKESANSKRLIAKISGNTQAFGSRGSCHYYRFYMEKFVHDRDSYAYELELKNGKAKLAIEKFILCLNKQLGNYPDGNLNQLFKDIFLSQIDFIDRSLQNPYNGSLKECPRLNFWQKLTDYIGKEWKFRLSITKPETTLKTTWNWLKRQAKGFINILKKGSEQIGVDYKILIDYLTVKDDEKMIYKPVIIQQDIGLKISELAVDGLSAIMSQEEINEFTEFAIASMYG